jgi:hypothetical protein
LIIYNKYDNIPINCNYRAKAQKQRKGSNMSEQTHNPPIETHRDGAVSAKIWRNVNKDGKPSYNVTFQRTYTDPKTQQVAESRSFMGTDILKVPQLASDAYRSIGKMRELDRTMATPEQAQEPQLDVNQDQSPQPAQHHPQEGMAAQRDAAMQNAAPTQKQAPSRGPTYER